MAEVVLYINASKKMQFFRCLAKFDLLCVKAFFQLLSFGLSCIQNYCGSHKLVDAVRNSEQIYHFSAPYLDQNISGIRNMKQQKGEFGYLWGRFPRILYISVNNGMKEEDEVRTHSQPSLMNHCLIKRAHNMRCFYILEET